MAVDKVPGGSSVVGLYTMGRPAQNLSNADIERELTPLAADDPRILALYLFGSRGRHEETEDSDVDLGVLFRRDKEETLREVLLLEDLFERRLGLPVDLIDVGRSSAFLALDVIRGDRIYCTDPDYCDDFELYVMRRAGDLAFFEKELRPLLLQS
jgi:predicted nucleotidyltransferase